MNSKNLQDHVDFTEQYISKYISLADTKAMWGFTIGSAALLYLVNIVDLTEMKFDSLVEFLALFVVGGIGLALIYGCAMAYLTIYPNVKSSPSDDLIFFGSIAKVKSAEVYSGKVLATSSEDLVKARLVHCHDLAKVCDQKYQALKKSQIALFSGILFFAILRAFTVA